MEKLNKPWVFNSIKGNIIGHKQDKEKKSLMYIIQFNTLQHEMISRTERSLKEFIKLENFFKSQKFLNKIITQDSSQNTEEEDNFDDPSYEQIMDKQAKLNLFLEEIFSRQDLFQNKETKNFFEVNGMKIDGSMPPRLLLRMRISEELSVNDFVYDADEGLLAVAVQNATVLSKLGRVWSIIEPEILGAFYIYKKDQVQGRQLPVFKQAVVKEYESKLMTVTLCSKYSKFYFGFHDGQLMVYDYKNAKSDSLLEKLYPTNECILFLNSFSEAKLLMITPTSMKILRADNCEPIGGGSLKQRLDGAHICSYSIDSKNMRLFLGNSYGDIYIYEIKENQPKFIDSVNITKKPIECLIFKKGNVFCGHQAEISIWSVVSSPKFQMKNTATFILPASKKAALPDCQVSALEYFPSQKLFISGFSNGLIIYWDATTGDVVGAHQPSLQRVSKLSLLEDKEILYCGFYSGDLRIYKLGDVPEEVSGELDSH